MAASRHCIGPGSGGRHLDFLRQANVLTITYTAQVNDGTACRQPARDHHDHGTNDAPVITGATSPAAVAEIDDAHAQEKRITGTLTATISTSATR